MPSQSSTFWYVIRGDAGNIEFLADIECLAEGGRWGTLREAHLFSQETYAAVIAKRLPGARATCFD